MRVYTSSADSILEVSQLLLRGEVVAIPTETVYGLAADALSSSAVEEIYRIKNRPSYNPLIIHVYDPSTAGKYTFLNNIANKLIDAFWPGPLTLVVKKRGVVPSIVTAGLDTVGVRMPDHPVMSEVLRQLGRPLAAPSANPSNYISPTRVEHVVDALKGRLKYVVDGGSCSKGLESTIVDVTNPERVVLLRPGPVSKAALEEVLEQTVFEKSPSVCESGVKSSPGQLKKHYSPRTPLYFSHFSEPFSGKFARIRFSESDQTVVDGCFYLTKKEDHREAEANLYALLQELDRGDYDAIIVDAIPEGDEWLAVVDRLKRASVR